MISATTGFGFMALLFALILISNLAFSQSYINEEQDSLSPKLYLSMGYYFPSMTTRVRFDSDIGLGTEINFEDDLKLEQSLNVFRIDGLLLLSKRSQLNLTFTRMARSNSLTLEKDIEFNDTIFYAGASANIKFDVNYFGATWRYSFFSERNWNAGLSFGLRAVRFNMGMSASLNNRSYAESEKFIAPAILLGVHGAGYMRPRLLARYSLEYFYLDVSDIKINVLETNVSLQYFIFKQVGLGIAYSSNAYQIRNLPLSDKFTGRVIFGFGGFNLFLTARLAQGRK